MRITVNGEPYELSEGSTVRTLIEALQLTGGPVAVERNGDVVVRSEHSTSVLCEGDVIEIVHFVGGG